MTWRLEGHGNEAENVEEDAPKTQVPKGSPAGSAVRGLGFAPPPLTGCVILDKHSLPHIPLL